MRWVVEGATCNVCIVDITIMLNGLSTCSGRVRGGTDLSTKCIVMACLHCRSQLAVKPQQLSMFGHRSTSYARVLESGGFSRVYSSRGRLAALLSSRNALF